MILLVSHVQSAVNSTIAPVRVWHCTNPDLLEIVDNGIAICKKDVDAILNYLKHKLQPLFLYYGGEWLINTSRFNRTYDFIDENVKLSRWFCSVYDQQYSILVTVIRIVPKDM
uniref:Phage protein n=1 Tax=Panagrellus redivivus TaxID=6233 RepID=A0A7E4W7G5_PANRE